MRERMLSIWSRHNRIIKYIFFGVLTTLVNYLVYFPLYNLCHLSATVSTVISWVVSVLFAYFTNKPFVFETKDWSLETVVPEFLKFVGMRVTSGLIETAVIGLTVDHWHWDGNIMKLILSVIVVVFNYIASRFLVFRK